MIGEGALVKQLGQRLLRPDRSVWVVVSAEGLAPGVVQLGLNPLVADLSDPFFTKMAVAHADVIYHLAGRRRHGAPSPEPADLKGLQTILSLLGPRAVRRYIYESSLAVYDGLPGDLLDEKAVCRPESAPGRIALQAEEALLYRFSRDGFPAVIFRSGAVYQPMPGIYDQVREGTYHMPSDLPSVFHRIYIEDYLDLLVAALEKGRPGQIYNVTDHAPHRPGPYFSYLAEIVGGTLLPFPETSESAPPPRYRNEKLLEEFNFSLRFPTFREGLTDAVQKGRRPV